MMSGEIFKNVGEVLEPLLKAGSSESSGKVVLGTVKETSTTSAKTL